MRQRALSVPWVCWAIPIPQKTSAALAEPKVTATSTISSSVTPAIFAASAGG